MSEFEVESTPSSAIINAAEPQPSHPQRKACALKVLDTEAS
jgi:hypothetical protein